MLSKTLRKLLTGILITLTLFIGANYGLSKMGITIGNTKPTPPVVISQVKRIGTVEQKVLHKEVITDKFQSIQKIQVIQTTVTQEITMHQGANNNFFKNNKLIKFTAIGKYILDLNKINDNNIVIDDTYKTIRIFTTKPTPEIELLEDKTQFQDEKGMLSFWDIKISPEESEQMKYEVKQEMLQKLNDKQYDEIVKQKAKESLESVLNKLTDNEYKVIINFVE